MDALSSCPPTDAQEGDKLQGVDGKVVQRAHRRGPNGASRSTRSVIKTRKTLSSKGGGVASNKCSLIFLSSNLPRQQARRKHGAATCIWMQSMHCGACHCCP